MCSPEVWSDARPRVAAIAAAGGVVVQWPNEALDPAPAPMALLLAVEAMGTGAEPLELGGGIWLETGRIWIHVFAPPGAGITDAIALRKQLADAFRGGEPALGIEYIEFALDPGEPDDGSGRYRMSLGVSYRFQSAPAPA